MRGGSPSLETREASKMVKASKSPRFVQRLWSFVLSGEGRCVVVGACSQKVCVSLTQGKEPNLVS